MYHKRCTYMLIFYIYINTQLLSICITYVYVLYSPYENELPMYKNLISGKSLCKSTNFECKKIRTLLNLQ